nr:MAG TPA: hypothetical protein [Caudoviricetes sp.]
MGDSVQGNSLMRAMSLTHGSHFFVHISVHLFQKSKKINKNKNYKNLVKLSLYSFYLFLCFTSFRWQGTFLSL